MPSLKKDYETLFSICEFLKQHDVYVSMKTNLYWKLKKLHVCTFEFNDKQTNLDCLFELLTTFFETKYGSTLTEKLHKDWLE